MGQQGGGHCWYAVRQGQALPDMGLTLQVVGQAACKVYITACILGHSYCTLHPALRSQLGVW